MAEAVGDWKQFLRRRNEAAAALGRVSGETEGAEPRPGHDGEERAAQPLRSGNGADEPWAEALARVHGAADMIRFQNERIRDLEEQHRELVETSTSAIGSLEERLREAERRIAEADRGRAEAEDWLRRIHGAILDQIGGGPEPQ